MCRPNAFVRRGQVILSIVLTIAAVATPESARASFLPSPDAAKAADKCQSTVTKAGTKFATSILKSHEKCFDAIFKCVQTKPDDDECVPKALAKCAKEGNTKQPKARTKLVDAIAKKCKSPDDLLDADGLGFTALTSACSDAGFPLTDVAGVAACVRELLECRAERMFSAEMPRAFAFADVLGVALRPGSCLEDLGGMGGVADPKEIGKPLDKCQRETKKAGAKFVGAKLKSLTKCVTAVFSCVQKKPGDLKCLEKAEKKCGKELDTKIPKAEGKLVASMLKRCTAIFGEVGPANAINVDALGPACQVVGVAALATVGDWADCVMRQHECAVEAMARLVAPRADELVDEVSQSIASDFCPTPTPTPTVSPTATPTPTPTFNPALLNKVFVSSQEFAKNLGSAVAYDTECNTLATAAGINNLTDDAFVAWTSDTASDAAARLGSARGFVRTDDVPFADSVADLTSGRVLSPLQVDEDGVNVGNVLVMTGTAPEGTALTGFNCTDWSGTGAAMRAGSTVHGPNAWTNRTDFSCTGTQRIYCFQSTETVALVPPPTSGKLIYHTNEPYLPDGDPDARCEADKPAGTGTVVALLARTTAAASTLLTPGTTYVRPDGQVVGTGQQLIDAGVFSLTDRLVSGPWQSGDGQYRDSFTWTGSTDISSTGSAADTCDDWTLTTGPSGRLGRTFTTDSGYWDHGTQGCNVPSARLFCIEQ